MFHPTLLTKDAKMSFKRASSPLGLGGLCFIPFLFLSSFISRLQKYARYVSLGSGNGIPRCNVETYNDDLCIKGRVVDNNIFEKWKEGKKKNQEMGKKF